ncbi:hypothetical protein KEM56_006130, partial [Ascosphaera pollenicola]
SKPPASNITVTKSKHAVPPPHETVVANTVLPGGRERVSHASQPSKPDNEQPLVKQSVPGPQLPPRQSSADRLPASSEEPAKASQGSPEQDLDIPPPVPEKGPLESKDKPVQNVDHTTPVDKDGPVATAGSETLPEPVAVVPEHQSKETAAAFSAVPNTSLTQPDGNKSESSVTHQSTQNPVATVPTAGPIDKEKALPKVPAVNHHSASTEAPAVAAPTPPPEKKADAISSTPTAGAQPSATVLPEPAEHSSFLPKNDSAPARKPLPTDSPESTSTAPIVSATDAFSTTAAQAAGSKLPVETPVLADIAPVSEPIGTDGDAHAPSADLSKNAPTAPIEKKPSVEKTELSVASTPSNAVGNPTVDQSQPTDETKHAELQPILASSEPNSQPTVDVPAVAGADTTKSPSTVGAADVTIKQGTGGDSSKPAVQGEAKIAESTPASTEKPEQPRVPDAKPEALAIVGASGAEAAGAAQTASRPDAEKMAGPEPASTDQPSQPSTLGNSTSETSATSTPSTGAKDVLPQGKASPASMVSAKREKPFALYAKPMLNHLQRVYDGLIPDSTKAGTADFAVTDHDHQQSADYFVKFVQKESGPCPPNFKLRGFTEFLEYMVTSAGAIAPLKGQDMTLPLPNYYSNSSHNTYLTGNQLYSECSSDVYKTVSDSPIPPCKAHSNDSAIQVLEKGCRCLEIDVWDGEDSSDETSRRLSTSSSSSDDSRTEKGISKKLHVVHSADSQIASGLKREVKSEAKGVMSSITGGFHKISSKARKMMPEMAPDGDTSLRPSIDSNATAEAVSNQHRPDTASTGHQPARIEPRVLHGHTLTREVPFREVCEVIRDNAFTTSDLPVIVSLEVHAGHDQQKIMVEIMTEVWRDLLVTIPPEAREALANGEATTLPSPADLRHKILIKVKGTPRPEDGSAQKTPSSGAEGEVLDLQPSVTASSVSSDTPAEGERGVKIVHKTKLIEELSALGIYTSAYSFKGLDRPEAHLANHIFSLSEPKLLEYFSKDRRTLFEHNRNFMMRTYPSQLRIRSSNPDPSFSWRQGVQFAALNWQNIDLGMMINHAMFEGSGGWVLKPEAYRSDSWRRSLKAPLADPRKTLSLSIDIYAGQDIPLPTGDTNPKKFHPYISCQLHVEKPKDSAEGDSQSSESEDDVSETWKRKTSVSVGKDPDFDGQRIQFPRCPQVIEELTFIR